MVNDRGEQESTSLLLRVERPNGKPEERYLADGLSIGRGVGNAIVLSEAGSERNHAIVAFTDDGRAELQCRGSDTKVSVGSRRVRKLTLKPGVKFRIGETRFECLSGTRVDVDREAEVPSGCPYCGALVEPVADENMLPCPNCGKDLFVMEPETDRMQLLPARFGSDGQWEVDRFHARGGMGIVLKGKDRETDSPVAIKVIQGDGTTDVADRFSQEIESMQRVSNPHVVRLLDSGQEGDQRAVPYLVMEWIDGQTLKEVIQQAAADKRPFEFQRAVRWLTEVTQGLSAIHGAKIIHRDLKPSNILIDADDRALIADLGIAKPIGDVEQTILTRTGHAPGTFQYMSPEQMQSPDAVDKRTDLFSLGVTFHELLTGTLPAKAQLDGKTPAQLNPAIPRSFERVLKSLVDDLDNRCRDTDELQVLIEPYTETGQDRRKESREQSKPATNSSDAKGWFADISFERGIQFTIVCIGLFLFLLSLLPREAGWSLDGGGLLVAGLLLVAGSLTISYAFLLLTQPVEGGIVLAIGCYVAPVVGVLLISAVLPYGNATETSFWVAFHGYGRHLATAVLALVPVSLLIWKDLIDSRRAALLCGAASGLGVGLLGGVRGWLALDSSHSLASFVEVVFLAAPLYAIWTALIARALFVYGTEVFDDWKVMVPAIVVMTVLIGLFAGLNAVGWWPLKALLTVASVALLLPLLLSRQPDVAEFLRGGTPGLRLLTKAQLVEIWVSELGLGTMTEAKLMRKDQLVDAIVSTQPCFWKPLSKFKVPAFVVSAVTLVAFVTLALYFPARVEDLSSRKKVGWFHPLDPVPGKPPVPVPGKPPVPVPGKPPVPVPDKPPTPEEIEQMRKDEERRKFEEDKQRKLEQENQRKLETKRVLEKFAGFVTQLRSHIKKGSMDRIKKVEVAVENLDTKKADKSVNKVFKKIVEAIHSIKSLEKEEHKIVTKKGDVIRKFRFDRGGINDKALAKSIECYHKSYEMLYECYREIHDSAGTSGVMVSKNMGPKCGRWTIEMTKGTVSEKATKRDKSWTEGEVDPYIILAFRTRAKGKNTVWFQPVSKTKFASSTRELVGIPFRIIELYEDRDLYLFVADNDTKESEFLDFIKFPKKDFKGVLTLNYGSKVKLDIKYSYK